MIRYRKLGYIELNVTDQGRSRAFFEDIVGLDFVGEGPEGEIWLRCDGEHHNIALHKAESPGMKRTGWMLEDERQFETLHARLRASGAPHQMVSPDECAARQLKQATRMVLPHCGATFEFYLPLDPRPYAFQARLAKIQRLGHAVIRTPHYEEVNAFLRDVLNFAESDKLGEAVTFFRCFPNPYHHGFGVARGKENGWHHTNFMVSEIDDIGRVLNRLKAADIPIVYGPGRHPASGSAFLYWLDPDGMTVEYSFGMEEFSEFAPRAARLLPMRPEFVDSWGGLPDPRMASRGGLECARIVA